MTKLAISPHNSILRLARVRRLTLLLIALVLFLLLLGKRDIVTSHEARVVQTAREMAATGWPWSAGRITVTSAADQQAMRINPWIVPVMNGQIRLTKPPLPYWTSAFLLRTCGFSETVARIIPALLGAAATLLIFDLARMLLGRRAAPVAALIWLSSYFVFDEYRKIMADPFLAFFTLLALWAWIRAGRRRKNLALLVFYIALALGFLSKGPFIFLHVGLALFAYHICYRRRLPGVWRAHVLGMMLLLAGILPWPIYVIRHVPDALSLWRFEVAGGVTDSIENARPWWFYLPSPFQLAMPWTPVWIIALIYPWLRRKRQLWFPLIWYLATIVIFSISQQKKNAYLLPVMPAQTLMITQVIVAIIALGRLKRFKGWPGALMTIQTAIVVIFSLALGVLIWKYDRENLMIGMLLSGVVVILALGTIRLIQKPHRWFAATALGYALAIFTFINFPDAGRDNARSAKAFAASATPILSQPNESVLVSRIGPEAAIYLPLNLIYRPDSASVLLIVDDRKGASKGGTAFFSAAAGAPVLEVTRLLPVADENQRWKLFRLRLR